MLLFEIVIVHLVLAVFETFIIWLKLVKPGGDWKAVYYGLVPSKAGGHLEETSQC